MSTYSLALLVHLFALVAAFGAAAVLHVAMVEAREAATGAAALRRLGLARRAARVFPVAMVLLVASGAWMVHRSWSWSAGFVVAGLAGVVFLGVCGDLVAARRAATVARMLATQSDDRLPDAVRDRLWWCSSFANSGVALAVVTVMVTKPSLAMAFVVLAAGLAVGAAAGEAARGRDRTRRPQTAVRPAA